MASGYWGGHYNPLVPVLAEPPPWPIEPLPSPTPGEVVSGYLEVWEPDLVVNAVEGSEPPAARVEVIALEQWLGEDPRHRQHLGLPASSVYAALARRERRFVLREPRDIVLPVVDDPELALFIASCLGTVESEDGINEYLRLLAAERLPITSQNLWTFFARLPGRDPLWGPFGLLDQGLVAEHDFRDSVVVFLMRASAPEDLVAFWNLRAAGFFVLPFAVEWSETLVSQLAELQPLLTVSEHDWPQVELRSSPWLAPDESESVVQAIHGAGIEATRASYPFWFRAWGKDDIARVSADEGRIQAQWTGDQIEVPLAPPSFLDDARPFDVQGRWANVLKVSPSYAHQHLGTVFPSQLGRVDHLLRAIGGTSVQARTEGLVVETQPHSGSILMRPPTGAEVWIAYLDALGFEAYLSLPGKTARELIKRLGSLTGVSLIQDWDLLGELVRAADVEPQRKPDDDLPVSARRRSPRRFIRTAVIRKALGQLYNGDAARVNRHLKRLTEREVIRAGLIVECECGYSNFLEPAALSDNMRCELCLDELPFPHYRPPNRWEYRGRGAFRLQGWGDGSYTVALALHCLLGDHLTPSSWTTKLEAEGLGELDFGILTDSRRWHRESRPEVVVGECKSEGAFDETDVERALKVRRALNQPILVFATLAEALSEHERRLLTHVARPTLSSVDDVPSDADVMVLTRRELFARDGLDTAWAEAGQGISEYAPPTGWQYRSPLRAICAATQRMHLGLHAWNEWREAQVDDLLGRSR